MTYPTNQDPSIESTEEDDPNTYSEPVKQQIVCSGCQSKRHSLIYFQQLPTLILALICQGCGQLNELSVNPTSFEINSISPSYLG